MKVHKCIPAQYVIETTSKLKKNLLMKETKLCCHRLILMLGMTTRAQMNRWLGSLGVYLVGAYLSNRFSFLLLSSSLFSVLQCLIYLKQSRYWLILVQSHIYSPFLFSDVVGVYVLVFIIRMIALSSWYNIERRHQCLWGEEQTERKGKGTGEKILVA